MRRSTTGSVEAVQLFADRAREAGGRFELDASEPQPAVAQICPRLDGIPLALELAAARTRMMTPSRDRAPASTSGSACSPAAAAPRSNVIRRCARRSTGRTTCSTRANAIILNRLGVFAGGFTLDAAEAVVSGGDIDEIDVLDGVAQLVDKSLVVADRDVATRPATACSRPSASTRSNASTTRGRPTASDGAMRSGARANFIAQL